MYRTLVVAGLVASMVAGPFDIVLQNTSRVPTAKGEARLVYAPSPFGVAVTADGRSRYDVQLTVSGLPEPSTLGAYTTYIAWEASTDLKRWNRLGVVTNGRATVGEARENKFLLVITAEASATPVERTGPTVLHGISPSSWLQSMVTHPLFRGIPQ